MAAAILRATQPLPLGPGLPRNVFGSPTAGGAGASTYPALHAIEVEGKVTRPVILSAVVTVLIAIVMPAQTPQRFQLQYAPPPVDNPLKGLVPYQGDVRDRFPHSLEFNYLPYSTLVRGYEDFDWSALENMLNDIASRGHQAIFRIYLEYPGKPSAIPEFLLKEGLKVTTWTFQEAPEQRAFKVLTPDYEDVKLRRSLQKFIAALGKRYDGDPRIGFITAGLLGLWGEWHNWPRDELFASKQVQQEIMDAYEAAFKVTPVLLRYPAGENHPRYAKNADRRFGYHDDSFAWATLHTGKKEDAWFFMTILKAAGPPAEAKWKTCPIGGEIRPEAWGKVFDEQRGNKEIQDFSECVRATHVSWLMDSGMFTRKQPPDRVKRAVESVQRMGYEFYCTSAVVSKPRNGTLAIEVKVVNRGVAPFYYDWKAQYGLLCNGNVVKVFPSSGKLLGLLPGDAPRTWEDNLDVNGIPKGRYQVGLRVPNPLPNGKPLRFANLAQDAHVPSWLTLGEVTLP